MHEKRERREGRENLEAGRKQWLVERAEFLKIGELAGNAVIGVHGGVGLVGLWRRNQRE